MRFYLEDRLQHLLEPRNQRLNQQQARARVLQGSSGDDCVTLDEPLSKGVMNF
jgi:hypothetical protein